VVEKNSKERMMDNEILMMNFYAVIIKKNGDN